MEAKEPLGIWNGPSASKLVSRIPTPCSQRKRPAAEPISISMDGKEQNETAVEPETKRQKMMATVKPMQSLPAKKATLPKKPPATRGTTAARPAAKKPAVKASTATSRQAKPPATKAAKAAPSGASDAAKSGAGKGGGKQKRPAWDLKGRLQDVESERNESKKTVSALQMEMENVLMRMDSLQSQHSQQGTTLKMTQQESTAAAEKIKSLEDQLLREKTKFEDLSQRLSSLQRDHSSLQTLHAGLELDLASSRSALSQLTADMSTIQCRYDAMKASKDAIMAESTSKSETIASLEATVQQHLATIAECEARRREDEATRRVLHNTIQELKGNIRVFCRVRPTLPSDLGASGKGAADPKLDMVYPDSSRDSKQIELEYKSDQATCTGGVAAAKMYNFEFDHVFGPASTQQSVFGEISQLVQSALDGYNVCIFAYGQTGSGKTHTMEGPAHPAMEGPGDECGMIPRAVEQVFECAQALKEQGWQYTMQASFLEIYNETIRDLLTSAGSKASASQQHDIKLDSSVPGGVYVTNVSPVSVHSQMQVAGLLERANKNRAVAATNCNERSSRSHSVFRLQITGTNEISGENCKGSLNLVDLAGSERLAQSGSVGDRLKETKSINKSLSNLGQVIMALANKDQHVPYRNSKLTFLLQNSLGGNSKTLMFVNISPQAASFQETLCSLRFATKVNQCNIGTARKAVK